MDFFTSLLKTYEKAELADLVDHQKKKIMSRFYCRFIIRV